QSVISIHNSKITYTSDAFATTPTLYAASPATSRELSHTFNSLVYRFLSGSHLSFKRLSPWINRNKRFRKHHDFGAHRSRFKYSVDCFLHASFFTHNHRCCLHNSNTNILICIFHSTPPFYFSL